MYYKYVVNVVDQETTEAEEYSGIVFETNLVQATKVLVETYSSSIMEVIDVSLSLLSDEKVLEDY